MKAAGKIAEIAGHKLTHMEKKKASPTIHYAFGTGMGALHGVMREIAPDALRKLNPVLAGVGYGASLFLGADELVAPALGVSDSPRKASVSSHVYGFISHAVYGVTGEVFRRAVRKRL